jgi:hypothetical protein
MNTLFGNLDLDEVTHGWLTTLTGCRGRVVRVVGSVSPRARSPSFGLAAHPQETGRVIVAKTPIF